MRLILMQSKQVLKVGQDERLTQKEIFVLKTIQVGQDERLIQNDIFVLKTFQVGQDERLMQNDIVKGLQAGLCRQIILLFANIYV